MARSVPGSINRALAGIDVGGTSIKLGLLAAPSPGPAEPTSAQRLGSTSFDLSSAPNAQQVFARVADELHALADVGGHAIESVGLGIPGLLDRTAHRVTDSPNLGWLRGRAVREPLAELVGLEPERVRVENDANVAALGEQRLGAARGRAHVAVVTLGTGVGGGLILAGQLFVGEGLAGEIGHVTIDPDGPACGCGSRGCLETLASASAAQRRAKAAGLPAAAPGDLPLLCERARAGQAPERELCAALGRDLGRGLATLLVLLDVRCFVFGGGFSAALDVLEPGIREGLAERAYGDRTAAVELVPAALGTDAGWMGAALLGA